MTFKSDQSLPLAGEKVVVKDLWSDQSEIMRTVRATGAEVIRKAVSSQFGLAGYQPGLESPWGSEYGVGGSSGGVAGVVYRGEVAIGFGSDGGGSIRLPAASLGLVGVKISAEGMPKSGGIFRDFVSYGVISRTIVDAIRGTEALLCASGSADLHTSHSEKTSPSAIDPKSVTIGYTLQNPWGVTDISPEYLSAFSETLADLEKRGFNIREISLDFGNEYPDFFMKLWKASAAEITVPADTVLEDLTKYLIAEGQKLSEKDITGALSKAYAFRENIRQQLHSSGIDYLVQPVLSRPIPNVAWFQENGPAIDFERQCEVMPFTSWVNIAGLSAISLPTVEIPGQAPFSAQFVCAEYGPPSALLSLLN